MAFKSKSLVNVSCSDIAMDTQTDAEKVLNVPHLAQSCSLRMKKNP